MAGEWMKVEKVTPDKPEIAILARKLGVSIGDAFMAWFRVYAWADGMTCPGLVPNLSLTEVDQLAHAPPRTAEHLASKEIGWMRAGPEGVHFSKWDRHNGKSAKARALESEKKRNQRVKGGELSRDCHDVSGTESGLDKTRQEESHLLMSNRKANGSATGNGPLLPKLPKDSQAEESIDVSGVDWGAAVAMAEAVGRKIPPITTTDRRNWFKFGVMVQMHFSQNWLMDSLEAVMRAKETKKTKQAHLYGVLKSKAIEDGLGELFASMLRGIEIPEQVWKSGVLEIRK